MVRRMTGMVSNIWICHQSVKRYGLCKPFIRCSVRESRGEWMRAGGESGREETRQVHNIIWCGRCSQWNLCQLITFDIIVINIIIINIIVMDQDWYIFNNLIHCYFKTIDLNNFTNEVDKVANWYGRCKHTDYTKCDQKYLKDNEKLSS